MEEIIVAESAIPATVEVSGETYLDRPVYRPPSPGVVEPIELHTLEGVAEWVNTAIEKDLTMIVVRTDSVSVVGRYLESDNSRQTYVRLSLPASDWGAIEVPPNEFSKLEEAITGITPLKLIAAIKYYLSLRLPEDYPIIG